MNVMAFIKSIRLHFALSCLVFIHSLAVMSQELKRPDVLSLSPAPVEADFNWAAFRKAQFVFVAQMLELYPTQELLFLARDSEYLYDVARLVTSGTPDANRIHLVNVSRSNMQSALLGPYLEQFGLHQEALKNGKHFVFIDTGFLGTIPNYISTLVGKKYAKQMRTHLVTSENHSIPSSRSFMHFLYNETIRVTPNNMHSYLLDYENLPKFYYQSDRFERVDQRVIPTSTKQIDSDIIDVEASTRLMRDLVYFWHQKENRQWVNKLRLYIREARNLLLTGMPDQARLLIGQHQHSIGHKGLAKPLMIDTFESLVLSDSHVRVSLAELNLPRDSLYQFVRLKMNVHQAGIDKPFISEVQDLFVQWIQQGEWEKINEVLQGDFEESVLKDLARAFFRVTPTFMSLHHLRLLVKKNKFFINKMIADELLSNDRSRLYEALATDLIETRNWIVIHGLIYRYLSQPVANYHEDNIIRILGIKDKGLNEALIFEVFSEPESLKLGRARQMLVETANSINLRQYINTSYQSGFLIRPELNDSTSWILNYGLSEAKLLLRQKLEEIGMSQLTQEVRVALAKSLNEVQILEQKREALSGRLLRCPEVFSAAH